MIRYKLVRPARAGCYEVLDQYGQVLKIPTVQLRERIRAGQCEVIGYRLRGDSLVAVTNDEVLQLMNKDTLVAKFRLSGILELYGSLPLDFKSVESWLQSRVKFPCARNVKEFYLRIGATSIMDLIDITHCVSLRDNFWVKKSSERLIWYQVSPWRNKYSDTVSQYALDGVLTRSGNSFSPVLGTTGATPHMWKYKGIDDVWFVKASGKYVNAQSMGQEPFSEYYASQLAKFLRFERVNYYIRDHRRSDSKMDIVTECSCYTTESMGAVSAAGLGLRCYEDVISFCRRSKKAYLDILNMLFFDCLILNTNRNFESIEFFINNSTLEIIGLTPIFNNNSGLCPNHRPEQALSMSAYRAFDGRFFDDLYRLIRRYKSFDNELAALSKFEFQAPSNVKNQEGRLDFVNWLIQVRAAQLRQVS